MPALVLCLVAGTQVWLTRSELLTPWKGGGFGMFSTNDDGVRRLFRIEVMEPEGTREIEMPEGLGERVGQTIMLPSWRRLNDLARATAAKERANGATVSRVRIAVLRREFDVQTLTPRRELIRELVYDVPSPQQE